MAEKPGWGLAGWPFLSGCPTLNRIWMRQMQVQRHAVLHMITMTLATTVIQGMDIAWASANSTRLRS